MAASMKMTVFWDVVPSSLIKLIAMKMEVVAGSKYQPNIIKN
jgi:hypothetical protein